MTIDVPRQPGGIESLLTQASARAPAPVEQWNPPYCGDIGLKIGRDGTWYYQGSPIDRAQLVKLFASILRRDNDGQHYLVTPVEKVSVMVEDAPFLAVEMEVQGSGRDQQLIFRTNIDDIVLCGPNNPMRFALEPSSGGLKPYVLVRGQLEALVTRSVYYDLMDLSGRCEAPDADGIWSGGQLFEFPKLGDL